MDPAYNPGKTWWQKNMWWVKIIIGIAFVVIGVVISTFTLGAGTWSWAIAGKLLLNSAKEIGISVATGVLTGGIVGAVQAKKQNLPIDYGIRQGVIVGAVDAFMLGGITVGVSQVLSSAMRLTRYLNPNFNGFELGNTKILSPNSITNKNLGGTIIKIGTFNRLDVEAYNMIHLHLKILGHKLNHIPIGALGAGVLGGMDV